MSPFYQPDPVRPTLSVSEAAENVIRAVDSYRDAINGVGHAGTPHDRMLHSDPCTSRSDHHIYSTSTDCLGCAGASYGAEVEQSVAIGDLRVALGQERRPWE